MWFGKKKRVEHTVEVSLSDGTELGKIPEYFTAKKVSFISGENRWKVDKWHRENLISHLNKVLKEVYEAAEEGEYGLLYEGWISGDAIDYLQDVLFYKVENKDTESRLPRFFYITWGEKYADS